MINKTTTIMTTTQLFQNKINNVCKTIVKAGVKFEDVKIGFRKYKPGCCYRVFSKRPTYGTIINSCEGNGMMECNRNWYDIKEKGYNIKFNNGVYIENFNNNEDCSTMNAEEFISKFYQFLENDNYPFVNGKVLKGFSFDKKNMTLYLTID